MTQSLDKAQIRKKYKGISQEELYIIPAVQEPDDIFKDEREKRVGVYARVSTDDPKQTSSFELQQNHYTDLIDRHPGWNLYKIYADEGISGTSLRHRDAFLQMIQDCEEHKIDLIITKSVSRFARNIYDCIGFVRKLAALKPPVGVLFETEGIYTLKDGSEMTLSFISTLAQEESHAKSNSMNLSYEMRFSRGIFMTPELLGYDKDEDGNLVINEDEALTVRLIFFMFLYGYTISQIQETLTELQRVTKRGNRKWTASSIMGILQNERHCGDVLAHKTYTPSYLDHKSVKNRGKKTKYGKKDHHEAIISRQDFVAAQQLIANGLPGRTGMLPHLNVIDCGALRGFVIINPKWTGFKPHDYLTAVQSVIPSYQAEIEACKTVTAETGTVDLRGFQIVRGEFFETKRTPTVFPSYDRLKFSASCLRKMDHCMYVEFLFDPVRMLFVVRPTEKSNKNHIGWLYYDGQYYHPRSVLGRAYLPVFYELLSWNPLFNYNVRGEFRSNNIDCILVFDLNDAEVVLNKEATAIDGSNEPGNYLASQQIIAMPQAWLSSFGNDYYCPSSLELPSNGECWDITATGTPSPHISYPGTTSEFALREGIDSIISTLAERRNLNG